ncbi:unnamed protein product [Periconia digitata]|uniref:Uncharacterized protein n=1 Tax=Periconia digitata TaxID=1303443 RepID=A0A9W4U527_9PLEO|nr:unnamed protein product [Periconia digitata]
MELWNITFEGKIHIDQGNWCLWLTLERCKCTAVERIFRGENQWSFIYLASLITLYLILLHIAVIMIAIIMFAIKLKDVRTCKKVLSFHVRSACCQSSHIPGTPFRGTPNSTYIALVRHFNQHNQHTTVRV